MAEPNDSRVRYDRVLEKAYQIADSLERRRIAADLVAAMVTRHGLPKVRAESPERAVVASAYALADEIIRQGREPTRQTSVNPALIAPYGDQQSTHLCEPEDLIPHTDVEAAFERLKDWRRGEYTYEDNAASRAALTRDVITVIDSIQPSLL